MTFDAPCYPEEDVDDAFEWAVDREFELRAERYEFLKNGGFKGAAERVTAAMQRINEAFSGLPSEERA